MNRTSMLAANAILRKASDMGAVGVEQKRERGLGWSIFIRNKTTGEVFGGWGGFKSRVDASTQRWGAAWMVCAMSGVRDGLKSAMRDASCR